MLGAVFARVEQETRTRKEAHQASVVEADEAATQGSHCHSKFFDPAQARSTTKTKMTLQDLRKMTERMIADINQQRIATLNPQLQSVALATVVEMRNVARKIRPNACGDVMVTQAFRKPEEQDALYAQGRTKPGKIVTYATGKQSKHCLGVAFDIVLMENGKAVWCDADDAFILQAYGLLAAIAKRRGWKWGGDWKRFRDWYHFEKSVS